MGRCFMNFADDPPSARWMPLISEIPAVQAHYEKCVLEGTSHSLAEMFAWQQPPGCMTDNVFNEGRNGDQWGKGQEWIGDKIRSHVLDVRRRQDGVFGEFRIGPQGKRIGTDIDADGPDVLAQNARVNP